MGDYGRFENAAERQSDWAHRRGQAEAAERARTAERDAEYERLREFSYHCEKAGPGGRITLSDGTMLWVGDVNTLGGECDDCPYSPKDGVTVVKVTTREELDRG